MKNSFYCYRLIHRSICAKTTELNVLVHRQTLLYRLTYFTQLKIIIPTSMRCQQFFIHLVARSWFTQMVFFPNLTYPAPELISEFFHDIFAEFLQLQGFSSDRSGQMPHGVWPNPQAEKSQKMSKLPSLVKSLTTEFIFLFSQDPIMKGNQKYCVCGCVCVFVCFMH